MRVSKVLSPVAVGLALAALGPVAGLDAALAGPVAAIVAAGSWGQAQEIRGTGSLELGGLTEAIWLSCGAPRNCVVAGSELSGIGRHIEPFVVSEVNGVWGKARTVPGMTGLDGGKSAKVNSVSCASAGNCLIGGSYYDAAGRLLPFVVSQVRGSWRRATEVPGMTAFNAGRTAQVRWVSCATAGNCVAGGSYRDAAGRTTEAFVASQIGGAWHAPMELPGSGALNVGGTAMVTSISCPAPGNCAVAGTYADAGSESQVFVASQVRGTWGKAIEVPGLAALDRSGYAVLAQVSCGSVGDCAAGGDFVGSKHLGAGWLVSEVRGTWRAARQVPGLSQARNSGVAAVSCAPAGFCLGGGTYHVRNRAGHDFPFVVAGTAGSWRPAIQVPGLARLDKANFAQFFAISCPTPGNCAVGGYYTTTAYSTQAFVASLVRRVWQQAIEVPGSGRLNQGGSATVDQVNCPSAGTCAATGTYTGRQFSDVRAFVVSQR